MLRLVWFVVERHPPKSPFEGGLELLRLVWFVVGFTVCLIGLAGLQGGG